MKNIYKEIVKLRIKSNNLKSLAIDECLPYKKAQPLRKKNEEISNKVFFYENFIKAMKKQRSV